MAGRVNYDPITGHFVWLKRNGVTPDDNRWNAQFSGKIAGTLKSTGYVCICFTFNGSEVMVFAHRLAWLIYYGLMPENDIDHINGCRNDNRICNLRDVPRSANCRNLAKNTRNTSGHSGVTWDSSRCKWKAQVNIGGKNRFLGRFDDINQAVNAARTARDLNGFTGRDRLERAA